MNIPQIQVALDTRHAALHGHDTLRLRDADGLSQRALSRTFDYLESHLGDSLGLAKLAGVACLSRFHFARLFRQSTGCSPMEYVLQRRLEKARWLLASSDEKISDIAASLGFFDQSHFTRAFRRSAGMTPGEYARRCRRLSEPWRDEMPPRQRASG